MTIDTTMGGEWETFPQTIWSTVLASPGQSPARRAALNQLCTRYWRPVYHYIRASEGRTVDDAKDLTQEFFRHILEYDLLARYQPAKGRFRTYLKGALKHFLAEVHRGALAIKRGGGKPPLSLDAEDLGDDRALAAPSIPEEVFDRQWASEVLSQSLTLLFQRLADEGKTQHLEAYRRYELSPRTDAPPTYEAVAQAMNISVYQVKNFLNYVRQRLQQVIAERIRDSVSSEEELRQELDDLFSG